MSLRVISICSPDKISMNMFASFLRNRLGKSYPIGELHSLMSKKSIELFIESFLERTQGKAIFPFYAKRKINVDPIVCVPQKLIDVSDVVVWFKLYSTEMIMVKDEAGFKELFESEWKEAVEKLGKIQP